MSDPSCCGKCAEYPADSWGHCMCGISPCACPDGGAARRAFLGREEKKPHDADCRCLRCFTPGFTMRGPENTDYVPAGGG
jgi:hypothetical protein